jgi:hypothetical protein
MTEEKINVANPTIEPEAAPAPDVGPEAAPVVCDPRETLDAGEYERYRAQYPEAKPEGE